MKHSAKITAILLASFLLAQLIGLLVVNNYVDAEKTAETGTLQFEDLPFGLQRPSGTQFSILAYIISSIIIGTILLFVLIRFNARFLWRLWYFLAVTTTLTISLGAFINPIIALITGISLAIWKLKRPNVYLHNFTELFIYSGLAALLAPVMNIGAGIAMLLIISAYDMYAVWKSKHMIKLANFQAKNQIFAGLYIPYKLPRGRLPEPGRTSPSPYYSSKKKIKLAILGGGDIGFPLIFAGIVLKTTSFGLTILVPLFTTLSLLALLTYGKEGRFYPAMPFLSVGCLLGYAIVYLIQIF